MAEHRQATVSKLKDWVAAAGCGDGVSFTSSADGCLQMLTFCVPFLSVIAVVAWLIVIGDVLCWSASWREGGSGRCCFEVKNCVWLK